MSVDDLLSTVEGIVHEETQVRGPGLDLTVAEVLSVDFPGRVDFGGEELEPADCSPHERVWRDEDDDYQWWHLAGGQYLLEYNEVRSGDVPALLQPREALLEQGAFHPTLSVGELGPVPLSVPPAGIRLKENARVSTLLPAGPG